MYTLLKWIDLMYCRMKFLIVWREREQYIASIPVSFRKYFKTKVAIWSQYKHNNAVKFLIGISPQGVISNYLFQMVVEGVTNISQDI